MNAARDRRPSSARAPFIASILMISLLALSVDPAAADSDISISFDEIIYGEAGSQQRVADVTVDESLVGLTCDVAVEVANQSSVHLGNDLVVITGDDQAVITGIEDTKNGAQSQTHRLKLGEQVTADLRFGQDAMSSLGFTLTFDCIRPEVLDTPTVERELPEAPPAAAVVTTPTYTG